MGIRIRWKSRLGSSPGASLLNLADIADRAMIRSVPKIARLWQREAKKLAPRGDTGNLKRFLKIRPIRGSTRVTLQHIWYTFIVDDRKPFLLRALFNVRPQALRIIRQEFLRLLA